jgi:hypothetical protein
MMMHSPPLAGFHDFLGVDFAFHRFYLRFDRGNSFFALVFFLGFRLRWI